MKKEDKSLIDVENVETTYFDNCAFFATLGSFLLQFCHHVMCSCFQYSGYDCVCVFHWH